MKKIFLTILFVVCVFGSLIVTYTIINIFVQQEEEKKLYNNITDQAFQNDPQIKEDIVEINWEFLNELNPDIKAWIYVPNTNINYPIVQGEDNDFYLTRSADKSYSTGGAIFIDCFAVEFFDDTYNTLIYGHNMWSTTMFTDIEKFKDEEFFRDNDVFYIFTRDKNYKCTIYSIYTTDFNSEMFDVYYASTDEFQEYLNKSIMNSDFERNIDIKNTDSIITLSTCSHERNGQSSELRYMLHDKVDFLNEEEFKEVVEKFIFE